MVEGTRSIYLSPSLSPSLICCGRLRNIAIAETLPTSIASKSSYLQAQRSNKDRYIAHFPLVRKTGRITRCPLRNP